MSIEIGPNVLVFLIVFVIFGFLSLVVWRVIR